MKTILIIGAGKSSTCLIDYTIEACEANNWQLLLADGDLAQARLKVGNTIHAKAVQLNVEDASGRAALIEQADIVISLLPAALHFLVAKDCVLLGKNLLTASYIDDNIRSLSQEIKDKGLFFLCEMGLDPGIDHMSAMQIIDDIRKKKGTIRSFRSHCGGLVAPESDDNPWHYKISWNPRNVVMAGSAGAVFKENGETETLGYSDLFSNDEEVEVPGTGKFAYYPNRDSLGYIPVYDLQDAATFVRTTLRDAIFCRGWSAIVKSGLTDDRKQLDTTGLTFKQWSAPLVPLTNDENEAQLTFLGLFDDIPVPGSAKTSADILQYLLETKLAMKPHDKDMIVMLHEFEYSIGGRNTKLSSSLTVIGQDNVRTAMAKTVGLPLGIAAKLILQGEIKLTGLHIPIIAEIYRPVLSELARKGIVFNEVER